MKKIKKNDEVIITKGKDAGRRGKVLRVMTDSLLVEGVNLIKKHQKPNPKSGAKGGIVNKEAPIHISNVAIFNSITQKADRVGVKILENGKKVRCFKSNKETIDV